MATPPLPAHLLARVVAEALREDLGPGDVTTQAVVPAALRGTGEILARDRTIVAGIDAAAMAFRLLDPEAVLETDTADGREVRAGGRILSITGRAGALLTAERTALNFLGRLCGIATLTRRYVEAALPHHPAIADTRKTTPTLRLLEKHAVAAGGGANHRMGLWDAILIKDNHVDLAGGVRAAIERARAGAPGMAVEIEVRDHAELEQALEAGAEAVLLDNFDHADLAGAVARARGRALIEVSGGVTLERIPALAALGVDRISIGGLTHSAPAADLTMRITS